MSPWVFYLVSLYSLSLVHAMRDPFQCCVATISTTGRSNMGDIVEHETLPKICATIKAHNGLCALVLFQGRRSIIRVGEQVQGYVLTERLSGACMMKDERKLLS